jgi:hypothetical protein
VSFFQQRILHFKNTEFVTFFQFSKIIVRMKKISGILILAALLGSCKSNSTDNNPNNALASPKTGSIFIFDNYYIDTLGAKIVNDPNAAESIDTTTVLAAGIKHEGKSNVTNFYSPGPLGESFFINYDASGDVSFFVQERVSDVFMLHSGWLTLPVAGLGSTTFVYADTIVKENGKPDHRRYETETDTYIGNATISVGSETLECVKIQSVSLRDDTQGSFGEHNSDTTIVWFSKKTGYLARIEPATKVVSLRNSYEARRISILLGYTLK